MNFIFDNIENFDEYNENKKTIIIPMKKSKFIFDEKCLESLKKNHREEYKNLENNYRKNKQLWDYESLDDYGIINKSIVTVNGFIIKSNKIFVNGGCRCGKNDGLPKLPIKKYDTVISITAKWASAIWHFPYEAFVALKNLPKELLRKVKIHVNNKNNYIIQWLKLINIDESQIITGNVYGEKIYLPRMGRCGNPYYDQILWIKDIIHKKINKNNKLEYVILIKRNKLRRLLNFEELKKELLNFCKLVNLKLYIHDDNNLPSLIEQQNNFNKAQYVFAPHGAGGIHLPALRKECWYIEFLNKDINICYSRLAYLLDVNYIGINMENQVINIQKIKNIYKTIIN